MRGRTESFFKENRTVWNGGPQGKTEGPGRVGRRVAGRGWKMRTLFASLDLLPGEAPGHRDKHLAFAGPLARASGAVFPGVNLSSPRGLLTRLLDSPPASVSTSGSSKAR